MGRYEDAIEQLLDANRYHRQAVAADPTMAVLNHRWIDNLVQPARVHTSAGNLDSAIQYVNAIADTVGTKAGYAAFVQGRERVLILIEWEQPESAFIRSAPNKALNANSDEESDGNGNNNGNGNDGDGDVTTEQTTNPFSAERCFERACEAMRRAAAVSFPVSSAWRTDAIRQGFHDHSAYQRMDRWIEANFAKDSDT